MLPFLLDEEPSFDIGDFHLRSGVRRLRGDMQHIPAYVIKNEEGNLIHESQPPYCGDDQRGKRDPKAGCLINYNRNRQRELDSLKQTCKKLFINTASGWNSVNKKLFLLSLLPNNLRSLFPYIPCQSAISNFFQLLLSSISFTMLIACVVPLPKTVSNIRTCNLLFYIQTTEGLANTLHLPYLNSLHVHWEESLEKHLPHFQIQVVQTSPYSSL